MHRRKFLRASAQSTLAAVAAPLFCRARLWGADAPSAKLDIACIGLGGQMHALMKEMVGFKQNIVAICDLDEGRIEATRRTFPGTSIETAKGYKDYREMLARETSAEAVVIASPDHWHAMLTKAALQAGKHIYCEKPLTHTVGEARFIGELARKTKVMTQTGNQGGSSPNFRRSIELIQAGLIGEVRDLHIWHPPHGWPSGIDRPAGADKIPDGFDWDFWLGPAPMRPYKSGQYHPGHWRGWYDFGGGSLADFCCHAFSMPVRALDLDYATRIEVEGDTLAKDSFPKSCKVHFHFPPRGKRGPVALHFYTGGDMPETSITAGLARSFGNVPTTGCLVVGDKGMISAGLWNSECYLSMNGDKEFLHADNHDAAKPIPRTLPRAPRGNVREWIDACKGGPKTFSPFEIGSHVTEVGASGLIALRLGRQIEWDGAAMRVKGEPATAAWIEPQHRGDYAL